MTHFNWLKKLPLTTACLATGLLLPGKLAPATAATLTFEVTGTITALDGAGESLDSLRGSNIGDPVSGSYSFDDSVIIDGNLSPLTEFVLEFASGEAVNLDFFRQGTINLDTGAIRLPNPSLPFPLFAGFSAVDNRFSSSARNTAIVGTFFAQQVTDVESITEPNLLLGLFTLSMGNVLISFVTTKVSGN